jgi:Spy/CpxP family protein refolding chaperone
MRLCKMILALGVAALMCAPALAQQGRGRGGFGGGGIGTLAQNKSVQEELKLDKDAVTKVEDALKKVNEDLKDDVAKLRDRNTSREDRQAINKKVNEAQEKALKGVLSDKQLARLEQIRRQQQGLRVFQDEEVAKTLKLTDDQKTKIKEIGDTLQKDITDLNPGGGGGRRGNPENLQKIQTMRKDAMSNATKTLDDAQKKSLKELLGEPFEVKFDRGAGGRRGQPNKPRTDF